MIAILLSALINRLRGWESGWQRWHGKYPCALMMGLLWGVQDASAATGVVVAAGYALWAAKGWGDYVDFSARSNKEVGLIDGVMHGIGQPWRDGVSMALRGLYAWPMCVALAMIDGAQWKALIGLLMLMQGVFYGVGHRLWPDMSGRATVCAEWLTGAWMGCLLWLLCE